MKSWVYIFVLIICSCFSNDEQINTLAKAIENKKVVLDNVIACAASTVNVENSVDIYLYPREGAHTIAFYETVDANVDKNDFNNYTIALAPLIGVFNGYLLKFEASIAEEKWIIVAFEEKGKTHLSNPIRLKQNTKPTEYNNENVSIDLTDELMPKFLWTDGIYDDTKIYFEVVSDVDDNFISGTYTFEKEFQYYKLDNIVLNITMGTPPSLLENSIYNFSMLAVSEDNWVNLFSKISFTAE